MIAIVRWYVSTLYGSFVGRTVKSGGFERKPYNPILGEQFVCYWPDLDIGQTRMLAEQGLFHVSTSSKLCSQPPSSSSCLFLVKWAGWCLLEWPLRAEDQVHWDRHPG